MAKIKILSYYGDYSEDYLREVIQDVTSWDEVDDETYQHLLRWVNMKNRLARSGDVRYVLFLEEQLDFKTCIADYLKHIEKEEQAAKDRKAKADEAKKARAKKRADKDKQNIAALAKQLGIDEKEVIALQKKKK